MWNVRISADGPTCGSPEVWIFPRFMLRPAGGDGFFVCILSFTQAQRSTKEMLFPIRWQESLPFIHSSPCTAWAAISASWCMAYSTCTLCPDPILPLHGCCGLCCYCWAWQGLPTWPLKGKWLFMANGPCSKGQAVAAWVSCPAESPSTEQTPSPCPMPPVSIHSCTCREKIKLNLCTCTVCKVHPFLCACGGWVWVVFSLKYEQEVNMYLFPEQQGRKTPGTNRQWVKKTNLSWW